MKKAKGMSRRDLLQNVAVVAAAGAISSSRVEASSQAARPASGAPRVLVLMGDRFHNQASIRIALHPIFTDLTLPVDYTTNYYDLSADLLRPYQLFVCFRDNAVWPGGYLESEEDPVGRGGGIEGLENREEYPPEKSEDWMTEEQGRAVKDFVSRGNGFLSLHNSSYISRSSKTYRDVQGGIALGHTPVRPFKVRIANKEHPITQGVEDFMVMDEQQYVTYDKDQNDVLLRAENLDGLTFVPGAPSAGGRGGRGPGGFQNRGANVSGGSAPGDLGTTSINGWAHTYEQGRVVFLALGHVPSATAPEYIKIQKNAVRWLLKMA
jgi:trehalose utilization protein